jgi:hypothetical protein
MILTLAHKIALAPIAKERISFAKAAGTARFACWNAWPRVPR